MDESEKHKSPPKSPSERSWVLIFLWASSFFLMCTLVGITGAYMHDKLVIVRQQTGHSGISSWVMSALVLAIAGSLWNIFAIFTVLSGVVYRRLLLLSLITGDVIAAGLLLYVTVIYGRYFRWIDCNQLDEINFGTNFWEQGVDHTFASWGTSTQSRCRRAKAVPGLAGTVAGVLLLGTIYLMYRFFVVRKAGRS